MMEATSEASDANAGDGRPDIAPDRGECDIISCVILPGLRIGSGEIGLFQLDSVDKSAGR